MANRSITQLQVANYPLTGMEVVPLVQGGITKQALVADIVSLANVTLASDTTTATPVYPVFAEATTGQVSTLYTSNPNYTFTPSLGLLSSPVVKASNGVFINANTVSQNLSILAGTNGLSAGPMSVNAGVTVSTAAGSTWIVDGTGGGGSGVPSFSGGTTGLTPNTPTTSAIVLGGVLNVANGGTGVATLSGVLYGNGTGAMTAATGAQIISVIGATPVASANAISNTGGWSITPSGTKIYFNYNGTNVGSLDSTGNFVVTGSVTAFGAP